MTAQIKQQTLIAGINMINRKTLLQVLLALLFLYGLYLVWAVLAFGGGCNKMSSETHIIPSGYIGMVYIVFNQKEGKRREYEKSGSRIYRVPKSGILRTKFKGNFGWINAGDRIKFYYSKSDSLLSIHKLITEQEFEADIDSNEVVVFEYGYGGARSNFGLKEDVLSYIIDSFKNFDKREEYILTKEKFDNWNQ